jgi:hypothetical protein
MPSIKPKKPGEAKATASKTEEPRKAIRETRTWSNRNESRQTRTWSNHNARPATS